MEAVEFQQYGKQIKKEEFNCPVCKGLTHRRKHEDNRTRDVECSFCMGGGITIGTTVRK